METSNKSLNTVTTRRFVSRFAIAVASSLVIASLTYQYVNLEFQHSSRLAMKSLQHIYAMLVRSQTENLQRLANGQRANGAVLSPLEITDFADSFTLDDDFQPLDPGRAGQEVKIGDRPKIYESDDSMYFLSSPLIGANGALYHHVGVKVPEGWLVARSSLVELQRVAKSYRSEATSRDYLVVSRSAQILPISLTGVYGGPSLAQSRETRGQDGFVDIRTLEQPISVGFLSLAGAPFDLAATYERGPVFVRAGSAGLVVLILLVSILWFFQAVSARDEVRRRALLELLKRTVESPSGNSTHLAVPNELIQSDLSDLAVTVVESFNDLLRDSRRASLIYQSAIGFAGAMTNREIIQRLLAMAVDELGTKAAIFYASGGDPGLVSTGYANGQYEHVHGEVPEDLDDLLHFQTFIIKVRDSEYGVLALDCEGVSDETLQSAFVLVGMCEQSLARLSDIYSSCQTDLFAWFKSLSDKRPSAMEERAVSIKRLHKASDGSAAVQEFIYSNDGTMALFVSVSVIAESQDSHLSTFAIRSLVRSLQIGIDRQEERRIPPLENIASIINEIVSKEEGLSLNLILVDFASNQLRYLSSSFDVPLMLRGGADKFDIVPLTKVESLSRGDRMLRKQGIMATTSDDFLLVFSAGFLDQADHHRFGNVLIRKLSELASAESPELILRQVDEAYEQYSEGAVMVSDFSALLIPMQGQIKPRLQNLA